VSQEVIRNQATGIISARDVALKWDGTDLDGQSVARGNYRFEVEALVNGEPQVLETEFNSNVDSVTLGQSGDVTLNVAGAGPIPLSKVTEIF